MSNKLKKNIGQGLIIFVLCLFSFVQIFPFYLQLVNSLQPLSFQPQYGKMYFWPESVNFSNYALAFEMAELAEGLKNTLIAATLFTLISLCVVMIVGYVLGKKNFKGKKLVTICLLGTMMIPGEILMVPNYFLMVNLNWLNDLKALFLPGIVNIFGIFLVKQYMNTIPDSLLESAELDATKDQLVVATNAAFEPFEYTKGDKYYGLAQKYLPKGASGVVAFGVKGTRADAQKLMDSLKLAAIVVHVADARTCVLHPASMTHRQLTDEQLVKAGISPTMVRFSVGIEHIDDILADLEQAFEQI